MKETNDKLILKVLGEELNSFKEKIESGNYTEAIVVAYKYVILSKLKQIELKEQKKTLSKQRKILEEELIKKFPQLKDKIIINKIKKTTEEIIKRKLK